MQIRLIYPVCSPIKTSYNNPTNKHLTPYQYNPIIDSFHCYFIVICIVIGSRQAAMRILNERRKLWFEMQVSQSDHQNN